MAKVPEFKNHYDILKEQLSKDKEYRDIDLCYMSIELFSENDIIKFCKDINNKDMIKKILKKYFKNKSTVINFNEVYRYPIIAFTTPTQILESELNKNDNDQNINAILDSLNYPYISLETLKKILVYIIEKSDIEDMKKIIKYIL